MYNHRVRYRYNLPQDIISGVQVIEFELEKDLAKDGPGRWKQVCANMIQSKTGISSHLIRLDDLRCESLGRVRPETTHRQENLDTNQRNRVTSNYEDENEINSSESSYFDRDRNENVYEEFTRRQREIRDTDWNISDENLSEDDLNNSRSSIFNRLNRDGFQETSQKWYSNKNSLIIITILCWPIGLYGWYMRSKNG